MKQEEFCRDFNELVLNVVPEGTEPVMIDIWFQDEARAGQKGMLSRVWARKEAAPASSGTTATATPISSRRPVPSVRSRLATFATAPIPSK